MLQLLFLLVVWAAVVVPGQGSPINCPRGGSYYDEETNRRECCEDICLHAVDSTAKAYCKSKCPGFDAEIRLPVQPAKGDSADQEPPVKETARDDHQQADKSSEDHGRDSGIDKGVVVGPVIGGVLLCVVVVAVVVVMRRRKPQHHSSVPEGDYEKVPKKDGEHPSLTQNTPAA